MNVMCLSARKESVCNNIIDKFKVFFKTHDNINMDDVLYTLQVGRKNFEYRWAAVCETKEDFIRSLAGEDLKSVKMARMVKKNSNIIFAFAGQGSQYVGMGKMLYQNNCLYKKYFDECADILLNILKDDIRKIIFEQEDDEVLAQTRITQPVIFSVEYSLAKTLIDMGIKPRALIGHSLGEYTAACIADVFCLKDALRIVCKRGGMMQKCEAGSMLSVGLSEKNIRNRLIENIEIAAVNAEDMCVIAGRSQDVMRQQEILESEGIGCKKLATSHGFHTMLVEPALEELRNEIENTKLNQPQIPYVSNLTGAWIEGRQAVDVNYWLQHARRTVKFTEASNCILSTFQEALVLEVGPGRTMTSLIRKASNWSNKCRTTLFLANNGEENELKQFYNGLAELWISGVDINWNNYYRGRKMKKVPLPSYCFERDTHILNAKYQNYNLVENYSESNEEYEVDSTLFEKSRRNISAIYEEPKGDIEINLTNFLGKLLGIKNIGRYDNFFELGGNSMLGTQVISWVNNQYPVNMTMNQFFEKSTVCELAEAINAMLMEMLEGLSLEEMNMLMT